MFGGINIHGSTLASYYVMVSVYLKTWLAGLRKWPLKRKYAWNVCFQKGSAHKSTTNVMLAVGCRNVYFADAVFLSFRKS